MKSLDKGPGFLDKVDGGRTGGALTELGDRYSRSNELDCAVFAFEQALKQDDRLPDTRSKLARTLLQKGDSRRAIDELQTVVRQDPESAEAHNALGLAFQHTGSLDAAVEEFRTTVRIDPCTASREFCENPVIRRPSSTKVGSQLLGRLAESAAKGRDWPQAFALLEEALHACGQCAALADLGKQKGLFQCRTGDLQREKQELEAALKLEPDDPEVLKALQMAENALQR